MDLFAAIADERRKLADLLDGLDDAQWATPSCCANWSVEDVAAHLLTVWNFSTFDYVKRSSSNPKLWFRVRKSLATINEQTKNELRARGREFIVADMRNHADDQTTPPGFGAQAPLTDILMHRQDICLPLGLDVPTDPSRLIPVLDAATSRRFSLFNSTRRLRDLSFRATDIGWSYGNGPLVEGPALPLAHAMWGRAQSIPHLTGPGVQAFESRLSA